MKSVLRMCWRCSFHSCFTKISKKAKGGRDLILFLNVRVV